MVKFSILLPTHNRADVLPYAIRSVLWQTEQDFELLIVGDGCTDNTAAVVQSFLDDPRIRWFNLLKAPYLGYANRNIALREAQGTYIAFMAHDDILFPDHLALLHTCLEENHAEWAYSRPLNVDPVGRVLVSAFNLNNPATLTFFLNIANQIPASCIIHTRDCFEKYGYWDETLPRAADWELWKRILNGGNCENFAYMPVSTCLHFRANWRTDATALPKGLVGWTKLFNNPHIFPPALQIPILDGKTEQEAFWEVMSPDPSQWVKKLREVIGLALDNLAYTYLVESLESQKYKKHLEKAERRIERLTSQNQSIRGHNQHLRENLKSVQERSREISAKLQVSREENRKMRESAQMLKEQLAMLRQYNQVLEEQSRLIAGSPKFIRLLQIIRRKCAPPDTTRERLWYRFRRILRK